MVLSAYSALWYAMLVTVKAIRLRLQFVIVENVGFLLVCFVNNYANLDQFMQEDFFFERAPVIK